MVYASFIPGLFCINSLTARFIYTAFMDRVGGSVLIVLLYVVNAKNVIIRGNL